MKIKENIQKNIKLTHLVLKTKNTNLILKTQQKFQRERHNVFTEEINKIALGLNYDKRIQSIDLIETQEFVMSKDLVIEKEEMR